MKNIITIYLTGLCLVLLSGCNTTRGFGQDIEAAGDVIEETAEDAKNNL